MSQDGSPNGRDVSPEEGYNYMHRAFLQAFMTRGIMTEDEIKPVLAALMTAHSTSYSHIFSSPNIFPGFSSILTALH
jgi:hypothetical protein